MTIKQRKGWLVETVLLCGLLYASLFNCSSMLTDNRYFAALSGLRTDACDGENVGRLSRHLAWVNDHLSSAQHRVLTIGEAAVFDYQVPIIYSTCFDQNPGEAWLTTGDGKLVGNSARAADHTRHDQLAGDQSLSQPRKLWL